MPPKIPFQLLEINVISAQDLASVSRSMHTFAVVWVHPERKLTTRIDQNGHTNPTWNEKFVFRVDNKFLKADASSITIDIYSQAWLKKNHKVGTVRVLISNLIPPSSRYSPDRSDMQFVALQVRRPSGRPQGILNMGVALLDSTMRSMPLYTELSASAVGVRDLMDYKNVKPGKKSNTDDAKSVTTASTISKIELRRVKSERTDLSKNDDENHKSDMIPIPNNENPNGSMCNNSTCNGSEVGQKGNGSLCSDVGPSASVVAAAIAKGIYPPKMKPGEKYVNNGNSILEGWTEKDSVEGLRSKLLRWRSELPAVYDHQDYRRNGKRKQKRQRRKNKGGLFSCFGNAYGCEFSITCGGANSKKKFGGSKVHLSPSDNNYTESYV